jgi:hypothetical protein
VRAEEKDKIVDLDDDEARLAVLEGEVLKKKGDNVQTARKRVP